MDNSNPTRDRLRELARYFPAVVLSGARQSGKTTLLKTTFPRHRYVTLDLPSIAELENLSHEEIQAVIGGQDSRAKLLALMVRGQFPELWRERKLPSRDFYAAYLATYLERDVRQILNVTSLRDFERFLRVLATRSAAMLNKSDVARDVGFP